jgi:hypothetical protein
MAHSSSHPSSESILSGIGCAHASGATTSATIIEDIPGVETQVVLTDTAHIIAWMSVSSEVDSGNKSGDFGISIDGNDSLLIERGHGSSATRGISGVTYRTAVALPAGVYTIKGRWFTEPGVVLTADVNLVAMAALTDEGVTIPTSHDSIVGDTTTSATLEDIDGLTDNMTLPIDSYMFGSILASTTAPAAEQATLAVVMDGEIFSGTRDYTSSNAGGNSTIARTDSKIAAGLQTTKGQWGISSGTLTGAPVLLSALGLGLSTGEDIVSTSVNGAADNTTSATLTPIAGTATTITIPRPSRLFLAMSLAASITSTTKDLLYGITVDGTPYDLMTRTFNNNNTIGSLVYYACTEELPAGTYNLEGTWSITGGTVSTTDLNLFAMAPVAAVPEGASSDIQEGISSTVAEEGISSTVAEEGISSTVAAEEEGLSSEAISDTPAEGSSAVIVETSSESLGPEICDYGDESCTCGRLLNLSIWKQDDSIITVPNGTVAMTAGANLEFSIEDGDDEIELLVNQDIIQQDEYYTDKFDALCTLSEDTSPVSGGPGGPGQPAWTFTTDSLWISKLNGTTADTASGAGFIVGDECMSPGEFEQMADRGYPQAVEASLGLMDICSPCLDCNHYNFLFDLLSRIKDFYDYIDNLSNTEDTSVIPEHPDGGIREDFTGVLQQTLAAQRLWDYMVHKSTVKFSAQGQGQSVTAAAYYRNISNGPVPIDGSDPVKFRMVFEWFKDALPWDGISGDIIEIRELDRTDKPSASVTSVSFPNSSTVVVEMEHPNLPCGEEAFGDIAMLVKNTDLFDDGGDFRIKARLEASVVHLIPSGEEVRTVWVHFVPPTEDEEEST